jgi:uncharacterized protein (DUF1330 family)
MSRGAAGDPVAEGSTGAAALIRLDAARSWACLAWETAMAKAYWVATYRSISDQDALAGYAKLAGPAIQAAGGRFLARSTAAKAYEAGVIQRVVIVELDSVDAATAAHDSPGYQEALKVLGKAADRDLRIVEGV